jgi:HEAT repeat protein
MRDDAVGALGELGPMAVGAVDVILAADAKWPIGHADTAIHALGPGAIPALRKAIAGRAPGDDRKRQKAAEALGAFKSTADAAVPELVAMLGEGRSDGERFSAALALEQIGAKRTLADFESALLDSYPIVREIAARAIGELGGPTDASRRLLVDFVARNDSAAEYAIGTLTAHGVPADLVPHLRALVGKQEGTTSMARAAAVHALTAANDHSAQTLAVLRTAMAKDESIYVREPAAEALLALGTDSDFLAAIVVIDGAPDQRDAENAAGMRELGEMLKSP